MLSLSLFSSSFCHFCLVISSLHKHLSFFLSFSFCTSPHHFPSSLIFSLYNYFLLLASLPFSLLLSVCHFPLSSLHCSLFFSFSGLDSSSPLSHTYYQPSPHTFILNHSTPPTHLHTHPLTHKELPHITPPNIISYLTPAHIHGYLHIPIHPPQKILMPFLYNILHSFHLLIYS